MCVCGSWVIITPREGSIGFYRVGGDSPSYFVRFLTEFLWVFFFTGFCFFFRHLTSFLVIRFSFSFFLVISGFSSVSFALDTLSPFFFVVVEIPGTGRWNSSREPLPSTLEQGISLISFPHLTLPSFALDASFFCCFLGFFGVFLLCVCVCGTFTWENIGRVNAHLRRCLRRGRRLLTAR